MMTGRQVKLDKFYDLLKEVIKKFPKQTLGKILPNNLPAKGVYFFFEPNETRLNDNSDRVVRIGTHAAIANSKATLYKRLYNHKGSKDLTGNHRSSVFRKLIGLSYLYKDHLNYPYWGDKSKKNDKLITLTEKPLEKIVTTYLHTLPFTILEVPGPSSKNNDRAFIERNSIALLSNYDRPIIDECSKTWLGLFSNDVKVIKSGLWNSDYVYHNEIDNKYFSVFEKYLCIMENYN